MIPITRLRPSSMRSRIHISLFVRGGTSPLALDQVIPACRKKVALMLRIFSGFSIDESPGILSARTEWLPVKDVDSFRFHAGNSPHARH